MTIGSATYLVSFAGNGVTTSFAVPYFLKNADIKVILKSAAGVETALTNPTHFSVAGAGDSNGGTLTMVTAPASGETLIAYRDPFPVQELDLVPNDPLPADSVEDQLDYLTMMIQRLAGRVDKALRINDWDVSGPNVLLPAPSAGGFLKWNGTAGAIEYASSVLQTSTMNVVADLASLRGVSGAVANQVAFVLYRTSASVADSSFYYWDANSTAADNATTVVKPDAVTGAGRWLRLNWLSASVDSSGNVSITGTTTLSNGVTVSGTATLNNAITVAGTTTLSGATAINNNLTVSGSTALAGASSTELSIKSGSTTKGVLRVNALGNLVIAGPNVSSDAFVIDSQDRCNVGASSAYRNAPRLFVEDDFWITGNLRAGQTSVWEGTVQTVSALTRSGSTATATITGHGLSTGDNILVTGAEQTEYNGVFQVTVVDADTLTYTVSGTPATPATGTINANNIVLLDPRGAVSLGRTISPQAHPLVRLHRQSAGGKRVDGNERARIGLDANDNLTLFNGATNYEQTRLLAAGTVETKHNSATATALYTRAESAAYTGVMHLVNTNTAGGIGFDFCRYYSGNEADIEFRVRGDGQVYSDAGTAMSSPADYAEMIREWWDGNAAKEDRVGRSVVLVHRDNPDIVITPGASTADSYIRLADSLAVVPPESVIGIVSANPAIKGGAEWSHWAHKYIKDEYGRYVWEDVETASWTEDLDTELMSRSVVVKEFNGEVPAGAKRETVRRKRLNPKFDPSMEYKSREQRPEWDFIGLLGRIPLRVGQPMHPRWMIVRELAPGLNEVLVR